MAAGATYEPIATSSPSGSTSVTFSSLGSYTDLILVGHTKNDVTGSPILLRFNSDTGSNYSNLRLFGNGTSASSGVSSSQTSISLFFNMPTTSNVYQLHKTHIFNYGGSTNKTILSEIASDDTQRVARLVGLWRSTAAITSVEVSSANAFSGTLTLYGIKAA